MNSKELVYVAFKGGAVESCPVTVPYVFLYHQDHFAELLDYLSNKGAGE